MVDPDDDSITRWVVRHYRYDESRNERRHVLVAAFDNEREFTKALGDVARDIEHRRHSGSADPKEHATGDVMEPGDRRRAATGHMIRRALDHGVDVTAILEKEELPENMCVMRFEEEADGMADPSQPQKPTAPDESRRQPPHPPR